MNHPLLVAVVAGSQFAPTFMISGVAVALPAMGAELGAGATSLGLVETLFLASGVAFLLPAGRLGDASDPKTLYKLGLLPEVTSRVLGTACGIATFGTTAWISRRLRDDAWSPWDALPALLLAGGPGSACWSSGGLGTRLFAFLVTLGAALAASGATYQGLFRNPLVSPDILGVAAGAGAAGVGAADRVFFAFSFGPFIGSWSAFGGSERLGALAIFG